jgi:cyclophilin family peptidyl-prolyl cis-trans isomerase/HEAT repeat protein
MISEADPFRRSLAGALVGVLALVSLMACSAPDPLPRQGDGAGPPGRLPDGLLDQPRLQEVVEATLARDGAVLAGLLEDFDPAVRARAAYGLGSVQDPAAVSALVARLGDPDPRVREDVAFALGQIEGGVGGAVIAALETETDERVRRTLVEAVGKRGGTGALASVVGIRDPGLLAVATLALSRGVLRGQAPEGAVDTLVARMRHEDPAVRVAAAYVTARAEATTAWSPHYREVADILAGYDREDEAAMHLLVGLGRGVSVFTEPVGPDWVLTSGDWRIRANATVATAAVYAVRPQVGDLLVAALDDLSPHVRQRAAEALASAPAAGPVREGILRRVRRDPGDRAMLGPLLPFLARVGEIDLIRAHVDLLPTHDLPGWSQVLAVLEQLPGPVAVPEYARVVAAGHAPASASDEAALSLLEMWGMAREYGEAASTFLSELEELARVGPVGRVVRLAPVLADSALLDRGSAEALGVLLERARQGAVRDSLVGVLSSAPDPRARALVGASPDGAVEGDVAAIPTMPDSAAEEEPRPRLALDWGLLRELGPTPRLVLDTDRGRVVIVLRTEEAPLTVQAVAALARAGRYDGVPFHRVIPNFVAQGGDVASGDGTGGPGFVLRSEFTRTPYVRGVVGMASSGKDTEGSQYFVTHSPQWHLDGGYTALGWVEQGMGVVDRLVRGDRVVRARVVPTP